MSNLITQEAIKIIDVRNVHKTYLLGLEGVSALRGVTFQVYEREFIVILGTSGCGKTTLLNLLGSIDLPTKGDVTICGQTIKASTDDSFLASLRLSHLGFVFQTFNLISSLTALENVILPMTLKGTLSKIDATRRATILLEQVGLGERKNHYPNQLSGGEQQRVTIARALSNNPKILLLDEPTGDLDTHNSDLILNIIMDLNLSEGRTIVMVTHDTNLKNFATKTVRMLDGKIAHIEENTNENRNDHVQKLKKIVQNFNQNDFGTQVRDGTNIQETHIYKKTVTKKPRDYAALSFNPNGQFQKLIQQRPTSVNQSHNAESGFHNLEESPEKGQIQLGITDNLSL